MTNVLVFGPPGIGKSTLVKRAAHWIGEEHTVDLEKPRARQLLIRHGWDWMFCDGRLGGSNVIGAADLDPRAEYEETIKVVLTLSEEEYAERRRMRDLIEPSKASQAVQTVSEWMDIPDALYIEANDDSAYRVVELIDRW